MRFKVYIPAGRPCAGIHTFSSKTKAEDYLFRMRAIDLRDGREPLEFAYERGRWVAA